MKAQKAKVAKWKLYSGLIALIAVVTIGFTALTAFVAYPTAEHRKVGQDIAELSNKMYSANDPAAMDKIAKSDEYKDLMNSKENVYTTRMGIGSGVLSAIISVSIVVALYRYLRRNLITTKPVGATVLIDTIAVAIITIPTIFIGEAITGIKTEPLVMVMLLVSLPFVVGFSALITYVIAKIAEWHYNRSHGFIEE